MTNNHGEDNNSPEDKLKKVFSGISKGFGDFLTSAASADPKTGLRKTNLFAAVKRNDVKALEKILSEQELDLNIYDSSGYSLLHVAAKNDSCEAALLLLENGADPLIGKKNDANSTPLEVAVNYNKPKIAELLARHGGYVSGRSVDGWTLLHQACEKNRPSIVEALIKAGADCNEKTKDGYTPLLISVSRNNPEVINVLLQFPAVFNSISNSYVNSDISKRTALHWVTENRDIKTIEAMVNKGAGVNVQDSSGKTPLLYAIENCEIQTIKFLLSRGSDINHNIENTGTPLFYACQSRALKDEQKAQVIKLLLKSGADPDIKGPKGLTPLHALTRTIRHNDPLIELLKYPLDTELSDNSGATPLMAMTIGKDGMSYVNELVAAGANPNARHGGDACTPLIHAVKKENAECVRDLLANGANPKLYDCYGKSALSYARSLKNDEIVELIEIALKSGGKKPAAPSI